MVSDCSTIEIMERNLTVMTGMIILINLTKVIYANYKSHFLVNKLIEKKVQNNGPEGMVSQIKKIQ